MLKEEFFKYRTYEIQRGDYATTAPLDIHPSIEFFKKSVEIDITEYLKIYKPGDKVEVNNDILDKGYTPFDNMVFTCNQEEITDGKGDLNGFGRMIVFFRVNRHVGRSPSFVVDIFQRAQPDEGPKRLVIYEDARFYSSRENGNVNFVPKFHTILYEAGDVYKQYEKGTKTLDDVYASLEPGYLDIFKHSVSLIVGALGVMTYINESKVLRVKAKAPKYVDNFVIEATGDIVRRIKIKPGVYLQKYALLNKRETPREHGVRGYYKTVNGKNIWVKSYKRGDPSKGIVTSILEPQIVDPNINSVNRRVHVSMNS